MQECIEVFAALAEECEKHADKYHHCKLYAEFCRVNDKVYKKEYNQDYLK